MVCSQAFPLSSLLAVYKNGGGRLKNKDGGGLGMRLFHLYSGLNIYLEHQQKG